MPKKKKPPTPWEIAKPLLEKDYVAGRITDDMKPKWVWENTRVEYRAVKYVNFRNNFRHLKNTIVELKARADDELELLHYDLGVYDLADSKPNCWDGSDAQRLPHEDFTEGRNTQLKPKQFRSTRDEYEEFTLKQIRGHMHQYKRSKLETNYWLVKRKKKQGKLSTDTDSNDNDDCFVGYAYL